MKYAYIVAANARYLPGLIGILNSLYDVIARKTTLSSVEVVVLGYKLPKGFIDRLGEYNFPIRYIPVLEEWCNEFGEGEILMRKRYQMPSILGDRYDSYCILDADMMIMNDLERYFEISAKTDLLLGCTLEQKRRYGDPNHNFPVGSGKFIIDPEFWNGRDLCCAPLFVGKRWYPALLKSWEIFAQPKREDRFKAPDMDALNICLLEAGSYDYTIPLSQHTWTGLHECMMKAHTRAIEMHGLAFTEDGEEINVIHGQYWNRKWRGWQIDNQLGMISREFNNSESYLSRSKGSFENLINWTKRILTQGKINANDYITEITSHVPAQTVMDIE